MSFLDKPVSEMTLLELQRIVAEEVSLQIPPPLPSSVSVIPDLSTVVTQPDNSTNNNVLRYDASKGYFTAQNMASGSISDGLIPAVGSPTPTVTGGIGVIVARWTAISNPDSVAYRVYISTANGFTPAAGSLAGITVSTSFVFRSLPDGTAFTYGTTYYVKLIAFDNDGNADAGGAQGSASLVKVDGATDILANSIIANDIAAGTITANEIAASTITAAKMNVTQLSAIAADLGTITAGTITAPTIRSAASGQRVQIDTAGVHLYDSASLLIVDLPTDSSIPAYFSGTALITGGTVSASALTGVLNTIQGGGALVLSGGVSQPNSPPGLSAATGTLADAVRYYASFSWSTINEMKLVNQTGFETDVTTGIAKLVGTETVTQDLTVFQSGLASLKCVTAATSGSGILIGTVAGAVTNDHAVTAAQQYTFSCYLQELAGGAQVKLTINWKDAAGTVYSPTVGANTSLTTSFVQYSVTGTAPAAAVYASLQVEIVAATVSTLWIDSVQLERGAAASAYVAPYETAPFSPSPSLKTYSIRVSGVDVYFDGVGVTLPIAPPGASQAKLYLGTATFNAGGAAGIYQKSVTVSTTAATYTSMGTITTTGAKSLTATTFPTSGSTYAPGIIQPALAIDSAAVRQGWSIEGNGRIRFVGPTINTQFWLYDDFFVNANSPAIGSNVPGATGWTFRGQGAGAAIATGTSSTTDPGVMQLQSGTTTTGRAVVATGLSFFTGTARIRFSVYFMVDTLTNASNTFQIIMGLSAGAGGSTGGGVITAINGGIAFQFDADNGATPTMQLAVSDNATLVTQSTDQGTLAAGSWHFLEFEVDAARTAVNWWHNFHKQTAITTHIPASTVPMGLELGMTKTATGAGTTSRTLNIDAVSLYGDYVTG